MNKELFEKENVFGLGNPNNAVSQMMLLHNIL